MPVLDLHLALTTTLSTSHPLGLAGFLAGTRPGGPPVPVEPPEPPDEFIDPVGSVSDYLHTSWASVAVAGLFPPSCRSRTLHAMPCTPHAAAMPPCHALQISQELLIDPVLLVETGQVSGSKTMLLQLASKAWLLHCCWTTA